jgi:hypothetical protein
MFTSKNVDFSCEKGAAVVLLQASIVQEMIPIKDELMREVMNANKPSRFVYNSATAFCHQSLEPRIMNDDHHCILIVALFCGGHF